MRLLEFFRPYRVIVSRRVTEEEQVSVEMFCRTDVQALDRLANVLEAFTRHREGYNQRVVMAIRQQVLAAEAALANRGEELAAAEKHLDERHREIARLDDILRGKRAKVDPILPRRPNGPGD